jgi:hypothetical protein
MIVLVIGHDGEGPAAQFVALAHQVRGGQFFALHSHRELAGGEVVLGVGDGSQAGGREPVLFAYAADRSFQFVPQRVYVGFVDLGYHVG